jgi:two-component system, OmpR family, phosphate regulon sensor histidine kinase PhoR
MTLSGNLEGTEPAGEIAQAPSVLQAVLDAARESILIVEATTRITAANRPAHGAFAWQDGSLVGKRLSEVIRSAALHEAFRSAIQQRAPNDISFEFTDHGKNIFNVYVSPIEIDGRPHAIGVFYDVTQIERLERVRQEFLSNISHELRTPLTAIMAFVETLEDGAIDDKENNRRFLGVIRRNAERMRALIADILELSLIESGNVSVDLKYVPLAPIVDEIFAALSSNAKTHNITLINEITTGSTVFADPVRLEQMLTNLIDNAIKFNREQGKVTTTFEKRGDVGVISVVDTGEGIPAEHLQRIFERFYRADRGRTRDIGGTGLGLAIVKHLARLHGGEISVRSSLGRGTTFSIEIPAK